MVNDKSEQDDEWAFPGYPPLGSVSDSGDDSKLGEKKQHVECLECQTVVCKGQKAPSVEPRLMLLGYEEMRSYDDDYDDGI